MPQDISQEPGLEVLWQRHLPEGLGPDRAHRTHALKDLGDGTTKQLMQLANELDHGDLVVTIARRSSLQQPRPRPNNRPLGSTQAAVLNALQRYGGWHRGCGWVWTTQKETERVLDSLVRRQLVAKEPRATLSGIGYHYTPVRADETATAARAQRWPA